MRPDKTVRRNTILWKLKSLVITLMKVYRPKISPPQIDDFITDPDKGVDISVLIIIFRRCEFDLLRNLVRHHLECELGQSKMNIIVELVKRLHRPSCLFPEEKTTKPSWSDGNIRMCSCSKNKEGGASNIAHLLQQAEEIQGTYRPDEALYDSPTPAPRNMSLATQG